MQHGAAEREAALRLLPAASYPVPVTSKQVPGGVVHKLPADLRQALLTNGTALDAWMLIPGWERGKHTPQHTGVSLQHAADHMDHICQLAGNARHAAIGTDLDGAFGTEQCPGDLDTIADLQKFIPLLQQKGYKETDIDQILSGNWIRFLQRAWGKEDHE